MRWLLGILVGSLLLAAGVAPAGTAEGKKASASKTAAAAKPGAPPAPTETVVRQVSLDEIRRAVTRFLEKQFAGKVAEFEVTLLSPDEPVALAAGVPAGAVDLKVKAGRIDEGLGRRTFQLAVLVNGKEAQSLRVVAQVEAQADVVTAGRYIKPDETIGADDLAISRIQLPPSISDFILDMQEVVGKRAVRPIPADKPIRVSLLAQPYAVRKGDRVTIEAKRGGLQIQASGVTKGSGQLGQSVTVTNQDSGKDLRAKVVGPGLVQVEF